MNNKVGRYVIISELGRGAMGIVYKASDPTIGREVALKVLTLTATPGEGTNSPQEMFAREVRAAGRLAHPSIVTIHDAFDDPITHNSCIVMELVPGMTLEKILDSGHTLTIEQTLYLVRQVAEGLDYAHRNQVIHRDLKPANILVTQDGRAKITDFGIAKVLAREGLARTVGMMGTPSYMSPEQVKGGEVDGRSDIFSLGIIIFTMLSGKKPFTGNTAAVMFKIVYEEPPVPSRINPQLTPAYDYLVGKCLAKDPNLRYASARDLLGDLDDLQYGRPPRSQVAAPAPTASPAAPAAAPPLDRTPPMPIPSLMKGAIPQVSPRPAPPAPPSPQPPRVAAPPPKPATTYPVTPAEAEGPSTLSPLARTLGMPISGLMKEVSQPPAPGVVIAPPGPPTAPVPPPKPGVPAPVAPMRDLDAQPLTGKTLPMRVPQLSAVTPSVPAPPLPPSNPFASAEPTLMEQSLPTPAPGLSAVSPRASSPPPLPLALPDSPPMERTPPMPAPDLSAAFQAAGPQPGMLELPHQPDPALAVEPSGTSGAVSPTSQSKFFPIMFGLAGIAFLAVVAWGYWKFHRTRHAPSLPPQVAVQTQPATPPPSPVPSPVESPTPPPAAATEPPASPVSAAAGVAKKPAVRKPKQAAMQHPVAPAPAPPQPAPVVVTPPPAPSPPTPSPEEIAKAQAAKLASIPRIVQVVCNYGLKEATFTISSGGQILFQETFKGKRKKEGFLGIKGSYQGTFTRTITVPGGASELSIHVVGGTDAVQVIMLPPPGGFVPTLTIEVDSDHLSPRWQSPSAAK